MENNLRIYTTIFLYETDIFPDGFIKHCKNNSNKAHNIPIDLKIT